MRHKLVITPDDARGARLAGLLDLQAADTFVANARDDLGNSLDALDVVAASSGQGVPGRYVGVHHTLIGGPFITKLATSDDLTTWTHRGDLDMHASEGTPALNVTSWNGPDASQIAIRFQNISVDRQAAGVLTNFNVACIDEACPRPHHGRHPRPEARPDQGKDLQAHGGHDSNRQGRDGHGSTDAPREGTNRGGLSRAHCLHERLQEWRQAAGAAS